MNCSMVITDPKGTLIEECGKMLVTVSYTHLDVYKRQARNNMELLRNVYGSQIHIFDNYIPFSVRMKEAVREGQSIFSYDPKGKATAVSYTHLITKFISGKLELFS